MEFAQFKKKVEVKRARKKAWKMMGESNVYAKLKQVKISASLDIRTPQYKADKMWGPQPRKCYSKRKDHTRNLSTNTPITKGQEPLP